MNTFENDLSLYDDFDKATEGFKETLKNIKNAIGNAVKKAKEIVNKFGAWLSKQIRSIVTWIQKQKKLGMKRNEDIEANDERAMILFSEIMEDIEIIDTILYNNLYTICDLRGKTGARDDSILSNDEREIVYNAREQMRSVLQTSGTTINKIKDLPKINMSEYLAKILYTSIKNLLDKNSQFGVILDNIEFYREHEILGEQEAFLEKFINIYRNLFNCVNLLFYKITIKHFEYTKDNPIVIDNNSSKTKESADTTYESILSKVYEDMYDETEESVNAIFNELDVANEKAINYDESVYKTRFNPSKFVITPDTLKEMGIPSNRADELFDALCDYMAEKEYITWGRKELHEKITTHFKETRKITAKEITEFGWRYFNKAAKMLKKAVKEKNIDAKDVIKKANKKVLQSTNASLVGKTVLEFLGWCVGGALSGIAFYSSFAPILSTGAISGGRMIMGANIINGGISAARDYSSSKKSLNKVASRSSDD